MKGHTRTFINFCELRHKSVRPRGDILVEAERLRKRWCRKEEIKSGEENARNNKEMDRNCIRKAIYLGQRTKRKRGDKVWKEEC